MDPNTPDRFDADELKHIVRAGSSPAKIDWGNEEHRRCIVACMVKGAYVLESDRAMGRTEAASLAPAWWESFHFRLHGELTEDAAIYGAIYEHVPGPRHPSAPLYVVAFRGTMPNHPDWAVVMKDLYLDFKIVINKLKKRTRSKLACGAVDELMDGQASLGSADVWLAGHSLGASLALDVGRDMMEKRELNLPTFLFNPPQVSLTAAVNFVKAQDVAKRHLHFTSYFFKAGAATVSGCHRERMEKLFDRLSPWVPNLYLHDKDWICQGFIDYFELRQRFLDRFPRVASKSMTLSYRDMLWRLLGKDKERPHLLPSAMLWKTSQISLGAHGLQQWWKPNAELGLGAGTRYSYPVPEA
ncbi:GDSL esterase/lipase At4g10955-like [Hordeum vulgare subsp. vulgare]|uniref:Fungal lipase-like domain-containing protein n=1 Tax=Hordeum vulgare subsp. vulgare TaxID=112509 RepID=A0A8I6XWN1_HORVV|nr:GDSL esterase/lipase At4g10955-like [Hordeum vulgare subsp. vulgare]